MLSSDLLPIYLNDHLAGATAGSGLAHRAAGANEGTEIGDFVRDRAAKSTLTARAVEVMPAEAV